LINSIAGDERYVADGQVCPQIFHQRFDFTHPEGAAATRRRWVVTFCFVVQALLVMGMIIDVI
jgi:hypothetical protein